MGNPVTGMGAQLRRWDTVTATYSALSNVTNISWDGMSRDLIETTALDTAGGYKTFITGLRDAGAVTLQINFTRDVYETLKGDFDSDVVKYYEIVLPDTDNTTLEFEGYVTEIPMGIPPDAAVSANVTIKITGQPTMNSGSGPSPGV